MTKEAENRKHYIDVAKSYMGTVGGSMNHADILHFFNTVKPQGYAAKKSDPWCAIFVSACAIQAFGKKNAKTYFPLSASCSRMITEAKAKGICVEKDSYKPDPGDLILYDWEDSGKGDNRGTPNHVGIVEKCKDGKITVIEGNYSNKVKRRTIEVNGKRIRGFCTPRFDRINAAYDIKPLQEVVIEVLSGQWGSGSTRKNALISAGYDYAAVQKEVTRITKLTDKVLSGKYGTGEDRKKALGKDYEIVQWNVNRILNERKETK